MPSRPCRGGRQRRYARPCWECWSCSWKALYSWCFHQWVALRGLEILEHPFSPACRAVTPCSDITTYYQAGSERIARLVRIYSKPPPRGKSTFNENSYAVM